MKAKRVWSKRLWPIVTAICLLAGCSSSAENSGSSGGVQSYKDAKSMILDILKSDEGRKAVQEAAFTAQGNTSVQLLSTGGGDPQQLQLAVKDVLTDTENSKFLQQLMTDPKFAGEFAKAVQKETKQLYKDLMKDPEYQTQVLELMKSPDFEKMLLDTMKSTPYRTQTKAVMQELLQSPLYRLELMELTKKVLEEESKPKEEEKKQEEGQGGADSGGSGGGGEGGGGGGGGGSGGGS